MKYEKIKDLACDFFRRLTGVKRSTFDRILEILEAAEQKKKTRDGKPCKLSMEDRLLMTLEYFLRYILGLLKVKLSQPIVHGFLSILLALM